MKKPILAIPKGRLYPAIKEMFEKCGIAMPDADTRQYYFPDWSEDCALFICKPKAVPELMHSKFVDFGFCGYDIMDDSEYTDEFACFLHTTKNEVRVCVCSQMTMKQLRNLKRPVIVATEFVTLATKYFTRLGIPHYILNTSGSTEGYISIGADCIVDVVETGETLRANNIDIIDTLILTDTCLFEHVYHCDAVLPENIQKFFDTYGTKKDRIRW